MSDGETQLTAGRVQLKHTSGEVSVDSGCCEFMPHCPCSVEEWAALVAGTAVCGGFVKTYKLKDYQDGDLGECLLHWVPPVPDSTDPPWDGSFNAQFPGWLEGSCAWGVNSQLPKSIHGKPLAGSMINLVTCLRWELNIWSGYEVWSGFKTTGETPVGIYTRDPAPGSGCDHTSSLEVVEGP
jgi:hypothetical protein